LAYVELFTGNTHHLVRSKYVDDDGGLADIDLQDVRHIVVAPDRLVPIEQRLDLSFHPSAGPALAHHCANLSH
jgi:hypothetical protein